MPSRELLRKYADVAIEVGLGVSQGDRVVIGSPIQLPEFTRLLVERAYENGALSVDVLWTDDSVRRARFSHGSEEAAGVVSGASHFRMRGFEANASYLRVLAEDPSALAGVDMSRVQAQQRVNGEFVKPHLDAMGALEIPWTIIAAPVPAWNKTVFPEAEELEAAEKMWEAIFRACRIHADDPVEEWRRHLQDLNDRRDYLTNRNFSQLRYEGPGTALTMGLTQHARWEGGGVETTTGRPFAPNIPTEEVFTSPHRFKTEGRVRATKPLSYFGDLIEDFSLEVSGGKVVGATADRGQEVLDRVLTTDDGSAYLGEAAMVPQSGAVAAEKLIWNNALYDENDACHIALGQSYPICFDGATKLTIEERLEVGLNQSSIHVDFVVGSPELSVYGVHEDGGEEPIIVNGEWGFSV